VQYMALEWGGEDHVRTIKTLYPVPVC
jgi:hypothetical protein